MADLGWGIIRGRKRNKPGHPGDRRVSDIVADELGGSKGDGGVRI